MCWIRWRKQFRVGVMSMLGGAFVISGLLLSHPAHSTNAQDDLAQSPTGTVKATLPPKILRLQNELKTQPSNQKLREDLADQLYKNEYYQQVIEVLAAYTNELSIPRLEILARSHGQLKQHASEVRIREIIVKRYEAQEDGEFHLDEAYLKYARSLNANGQEPEAIESLRKAIKINSTYRPLYDELLSIFEKNADLYEQRRVLEDMIKRFGKKAELLKPLCAIYYQQSFLAQAEKICKMAIRIDRKHADSYVHLFHAIALQERSTEAIEVLNRAAKAFPDSELVQWTAGQHFAREQNTLVAERFFLAAVKADPKSGRAQIGLAEAAFANKKYAEALTAFEAACRIDNETSELFRNAATQLGYEKNYKWQTAYRGRLFACALK